MAETTQWEYRFESIGTFWKEVKNEELEALLNEWGQEGWEVIQLIALHTTNRIRIIAKRPLTSESRRRRSWPG